MAFQKSSKESSKEQEIGSESKAVSDIYFQSERPQDFQRKAKMITHQIVTVHSRESRSTQEKRKNLLFAHSRSVCSPSTMNQAVHSRGIVLLETGYDVLGSKYRKRDRIKIKKESGLFPQPQRKWSRTKAYKHQEDKGCQRCYGLDSRANTAKTKLGYRDEKRNGKKRKGWKPT